MVELNAGFFIERPAWFLLRIFMRRIAMKKYLPVQLFLLVLFSFALAVSCDSGGGGGSGG